jgi:SAM-dependent methyltransferase
MMKFGERQVSPTLEGIRRDHTARYEWAAKQLPANSRVIDFACGVGYGTHILAAAGHKARGYDKDNEALCYADQHYAREGTQFISADGNEPFALPESDAAVCFETIEHIADPRPLLKALRLAAPMLLASVPNETAFPWSPAPGVTTAFHFRHYTINQFKALLEECGWCVTGWAGQEGPESDVGAPDRSASRTLIAVCQREALALNDDDLMQSAPPGVVSAPSPDPRAPKHVAILGLGPSLDQYLELTKRAGGRHRFCDETWAINALGDVFACDLVFHMDDVRIQEIRATAQPDSNIAAMVQWLKNSPVPVITSRKRGRAQPPGA